ncbi:MAG: AbrB/MazE/SpoVT family DNA-binding domain-containing protein [Bifidobacteriaceae bacterium]|jgi:AbrB family looped-hinge helix DNA binding protein|nr:AbrB/MazE/SpoVT family DNA-binding domain-containing protein [Bifidobacteriaceae bacterium]
MKASIDSAGRILIPKALRAATGLEPGADVDISAYGGGIQILYGGRGAALVEEDGHLVVAGTTPVTDEVVYALIDSIRK